MHRQKHFYNRFLKRSHNFNQTKIVEFLRMFTDLRTYRLMDLLTTPWHTGYAP